MKVTDDHHRLVLTWKGYKFLTQLVFKRHRFFDKEKVPRPPVVFHVGSLVIAQVHEVLGQLGGRLKVLDVNVALRRSRLTRYSNVMILFQ